MYFLRTESLLLLLKNANGKDGKEKAMAECQELALALVFVIRQKRNVLWHKTPK